MRNLAAAVLDLVYPRRCAACGACLKGDEKFFCPDCLGGVGRIEGPLCTFCGRPYPDGSGEDHPCHACMKKRPAFVSARAPALFDGAVREAVHLFKYDKRRALKDYLGGFIEEGALRWCKGADVVVAVPLHGKRLRARGFNQSLFLAERAAMTLGARLSVDGLARIRHTAPQVGLAPPERERNVRGAFAAVRPEEFSGGTVLLVDDVYTTGATVNECAGVLLKAGAKAVHVLTVARAV